MRRERSTSLMRCTLALVVANAVALIGCGGASSGENGATSSPEGQRYNSTKKAGANLSKEDIAAKKKEALAEVAKQKAGAARK